MGSFGTTYIDDPKGSFAQVPCFRDVLNCLGNSRLEATQPLFEFVGRQPLDEVEVSLSADIARRGLEDRAFHKVHRIQLRVLAAVASEPFQIAL